MIVVIGDNHFSDSRPWSAEATNAQIDYIINHPLNNKNNTLILTGDIVDIPFMSGRVYSMLLKFFFGLKFKEVYVVQGNHDIKMDKLERPVLAYDFLLDKMNLDGNFTHIHAITKVTTMTLEGLKVLFLPFVYTTSEGSIKDYENLPEDIIKTEYDLCVTHVADTSLSVYPGHLIDLSAVKATYWASGHVHAPSSHYVGSVLPNSSAESGIERQFRTYSKEEGETIVKIDNLLGYYTVQFPEDLPTVSSKVSVFTITSCSDESIARQRYGDIYIRKCVPSLSLDKESLSKSDIDLDTKNLSPEVLYTEWRGLTKIKESVKSLCDSYFKKSYPTVTL